MPAPDAVFAFIKISYKIFCNRFRVIIVQSTLFPRIWASLLSGAFSLHCGKSSAVVRHKLRILNILYCDFSPESKEMLR